MNNVLKDKAQLVTFQLALEAATELGIEPGGDLPPQLLAVLVRVIRVSKASGLSAVALLNEAMNKERSDEV